MGSSGLKETKIQPFINAILLNVTAILPLMNAILLNIIAILSLMNVFLLNIIAIMKAQNPIQTAWIQMVIAKNEKVFKKWTVHLPVLSEWWPVRHGQCPREPVCHRSVSVCLLRVRRLFPS